MNLVERATRYYKVTNYMRTFTTYNFFAINHGYPDAANSDHHTKLHEIKKAIKKDNKFKMIAEGKHRDIDYDTLYILESIDSKTRFIIECTGVERL